MRWFGKKNNTTVPVQTETKKERRTLMDDAATIAGMTNDPFATGIVLGRGHGEHKTEQAKTWSEVFHDEVNTATGGEKKK